MTDESKHSLPHGLDDFDGYLSSPAQKRRAQQPLAPRYSWSDAPQSTPPQAQQQTSSPGSARPTGRLSHRSRAGCWTCRGRKVKCDEARPRCGPCQRLNRDCDWDHRWNFSDATPSTQGKYKNVKTVGNSVWDPRAPRMRRPKRLPKDDLPSFATLNNDDDRERKATAQRPGTYSVVVTPSSFIGLPEYSSPSSPSRRIKIEKHRHGSLESTGSGYSLLSTQSDPNIVILDRFEDVPSSVTGAFTDSNNPSRRASVPAIMQQPLSITTTAPMMDSRLHTSGISRRGSADDQLVAHFRRHIVPRLIQPLLLNGLPDNMSVPGSARDIFEIEAARFSPLHHAICAVSALNLAYSGRCALEDAMQHYHQALSTATTPTSPDDLISDGVFLRHFLLFIYDISVPMTNDHGGAGDMWADHLIHLRRIALQRQQALIPGCDDPHAYTLWSICELDVYACLLGNGNAEFTHAILAQNALPPLHQQIPNLNCPSSTLATGTPQPSALDAFLPSEMDVFPAILALNQGIVLRAAKIAETAQTFRADELASRTASAPSSPASRFAAIQPGLCARWQSGVSALQNDLHEFWKRACPAFVGPENAQAGAHLPERARKVFQHALLLYQSTQLYLRTSMFPGQLHLPLASGAALQADTDMRSNLIINLANNLLSPTHTIYSQSLPATQPAPRSLVFALFMAGTSTSAPDAQARALELVTVCERQGGIGQNTFRTRQLLGKVLEMRARGDRGVEWLQVARALGLGVVNCGL